MKKKSNNNAMGIGKLKKFLILAFSIIVAAALVVTGILCFNPSKKSPTDEVENGDAEASAVTTFDAKTKWGRTVNLSTLTQDGTVKKGDIINFDFIAQGASSGPTGAINNNGFYPWNNGDYNVTLPKGTYKLELWGAQGGGGRGGGNFAGYGGYTTATLTLTTQTTIYVVVGGQGENSAYRSPYRGFAFGGGGYNGGGNVLGGGSYSTTNPTVVDALTGGAGGGATHIATVPGILSSLGGNKNSVLLVAGGGGGFGHDANEQNKYKGSGGGNSGQDDANYGTYTSYAYGKGGTQTQGGPVVTSLTYSSNNITVTAGGFGQGGQGGSWGNGSGAGGGGWYGGSGGYIQGGGGGSGHIGTDTRISNGSMIAGGSTNANPVSASTLYTAYASAIPNPTGSGTIKGKTGNGFAKLTVVGFNEEPVSINASSANGVEIGSASRGDNKGIVVNATSIARDPEGTSVYFSNGITSNYDAADLAGFKLYCDAACTKPATSYVELSAVDRTSITINKILKYPRSGIDGMPANGKLRLYAKIRDSFGFENSPAARGCAAIPFTINITESAPTATAGELNADDDSGANANLFNNIYLGMSAPGATPDTATLTNIYNPKGDGRYTAYLTKPLRLSSGPSEDGSVSVHIKASDLVTGLSAYDQVIIAINDTTSIRPTDPTRLYKVKELDDGQAATAYLSGGSQIANAFADGITLVGVNAHSDYQVLSVKLYIVEKSSSRGTNYQLPYANAIDLDIVFKVDNTRPVLKDPSKVFELDTLVERGIDLNEFVLDKDDGTIDATTHKILGVAVPTSEFILMNQYGEIIPTLAADGKAYYNMITATLSGSSLTAALPDTGMLKTALTTGTLDTDTGTYATGFSDWFICRSSDTEGAKSAFVRYNFENTTLNLTGLRASYSMYKSERANYMTVVSGGASEGVTINDCKYVTDDGANWIAANAGHFYILVNIQDHNNVNDRGIWIPLAIKVNNSAPTETNVERGQVGASAMPSAVGAASDDKAYYFAPMGITVDGTTSPLGYYIEGTKLNISSSGGVGIEFPSSGTLTLTNVGLQPLASDADNYFYGNMLNGSSAQGVQPYLNEFIQFDSLAEDVQNSVDGNENGEYFTVENIPIFVPVGYFGGRLDPRDYLLIDLNNDTYADYVVTVGYKIVLKNWTHNRYLYAEAPVTDCDGGSVSAYIAIKVENGTPKALSAGTSDVNAPADAVKVAELSIKDDRGANVSSKYSATGDIPTINYEIPLYSTLFITPYDLLADANMLASGVKYPEKGFTLNGLSGTRGKDGFVYDKTVTENTRDANKGVATRNVRAIASAKNTYGGNADYSSESYIEELETTLEQLSGKHGFGPYAETDGFLSMNSATTVGIDRLYFARTDDASKLDGYEFDPYSSDEADTATRNDFAAADIVNDSYVDAVFGSSVKIGENTYDLDYLAITALSRTLAGAKVEITLDVRDRTGAGSSDYTGVAKVRVIISIVNSTPYLSEPDKVYTMSTTPIYSDTEHNVVVYNTEILLDTDILFDNEGDADLSFLTSADSFGVYANGDDDQTEDDLGRTYLNNYVSVTVGAKSIRIVALNSTQQIRELFLKFQATDGVDGNYSTLRIRLQVLNATVGMNFDKNSGFTEQGYNTGAWTVDALTESDITATRYFVSDADTVTYLMNSEHVGASQMKIIVSDTDRLQSTVLSPAMYKTDGSTIEKYLLAVSENGNPIDYKNFVPYARLITETGDDAAVVINKTWSNGDLTGADGYLSGYDIEYYVDLGDGKGMQTFKASMLRKASDAKWTNPLDDPNKVGKFFDAKGRWIVKSWAITLTPGKAFPSNQYVQFVAKMRDDTENGGDTTNETDAYITADDGTISECKIIGLVNNYTYQLNIKSPGIVTYDYYDKYDGVYAVSDVADSSIAYVPTYDGDVESKYGSVYSGKEKIIYNSATNKVKTEPASYTPAADELVVKSRDNIDDGSVAGINSGHVYGANVSYDAAHNESPFVFSHTIEVSSQGTTYIPMSYMALKKIIATADDGKHGGIQGTVKYDQESYVAYDVTGMYNLGSGNYSAISTAITISDGTPEGTYTGANLAKNPYITVMPYEDDSAQTGYDSAYYNKCLSVATTVDENGTANDYLKNSLNYPNIVGDGKLLYLKDATAANNGLKEHRFGLSIAKKTDEKGYSKRAPSENLTISIKVAQCRYSNEPGMPAGTVTDYDAANEDDRDQKTAVVTFNLHIANDDITLDSTVTGDNSGYHTDLNLVSGGGEAVVGLVRSGETADKEVTKVIGYNDKDSGDVGYFYPDSLKKLSAWSVASNAAFTQKHTTSNGNVTFTNTASETAAQNSMLNYYGVNPNGNQSAGLNSALNDPDFAPNDGIYGTDDEGYSDYFNVRFENGGTRMTVTPKARTFINTAAFDEWKKSNSGKSIADMYSERGLVPIKDSSGNITGAYYPLKVLIYDSCGGGFDEGSYVCLELRVKVDNCAPKLSDTLNNTSSVNDGNKTISVNLSVSNTGFNIDLASVIVDNDLLKYGSGSIFWESDYKALRSDYGKDRDDDFRLESGDYLMMPSALGQNGVWDQSGVILSLGMKDGSPVGNNLNVRVTKRSLNSDGTTKDDFTFELYFVDSYSSLVNGTGNTVRSGKLTVKVHVTNQTPRTHEGLVSSVKMRVGDTFSVFATSWSEFASGDAQNSYSYKHFNDERLEKRESAESGLVPYNTITDADFAANKLHNYAPGDDPNKDLGYLSIASDDTPWSLRILDVKYDNTSAVYVYRRDLMYFDGKTKNENPNYERYPIDVTIEAKTVCTNMPVTFIVSDGGKTTQWTVYVTIESSLPRAITANDSYPHNEGLEFTSKSGVFELYMQAATGSADDSVAKTLKVRNSETNEEKNVKAYGVYTVSIPKLAYDPDKSDNDNIGIYDSSNVASDGRTPMFRLNNIEMPRETGKNNVFVYDKYRIELDLSTRAEFKITCLRYDPDVNWDELSFYVRDAGNDVFANALPITIRISTLYSSITNESAVARTSRVGEINSAETVNVKSYDEYIGNGDADPDKVGKMSTYQFLKYAGVATSVDQADEFEDAPIVDSDVLTSARNLNYDVRVYAFMDPGADAATRNIYRSKSLKSISGYFDVNRTANTFKLTDESRNSLAVHSYLVAGKYSDGRSYELPSGASGRVAYIQQFFQFSIGNDGVSISFRPVTTNRTPILFYVEVQKVTGSRSIRLADEQAITAGSLFYVQVEDSKPLANDTGSDAMTFRGKKGDYRMFSIYDLEHPYESLFTDSDRDDLVIVKGNDRLNNIDPEHTVVTPNYFDYDSAFAGTTLDWSSNGRAISIDVNNTDEVKATSDAPKTLDLDNYTPAEAKYVLKPHTLRILINRRIDEFDENGRSKPEVTIPLAITGTDKSGRTSDVVIRLIIENTDFDVKASELGSNINSSNGTGYVLSRGDGEKAYDLDVYVSCDAPALELSVLHWLNDPDFTSFDVNTDTYQLVGGSGMHEHEYITAEEGLHEVRATVNGELSDTAIASITPRFNTANEFGRNDFVNITVKAESYMRGYTGTAYLRIIDRSGDATSLRNGVLFTVRVHIVNSAPIVTQPGKTIDIVGSNTAAIPPYTFEIKDFVKDRNPTDGVDQAGKTDTYLRIVSYYAMMSDDIVSTTSGSNNGNNLVSISQNDDDEYGLSCIISPVTGFFGTQTVRITVADGDINNPESKTASFDITFSIVYNFNEIGTLNTLTALRGMTTKVTVDALVPVLESTVDGDDNGDQAQAQSGVSASADEVVTFNPGAGYAVSGVTVPASYVDYVKVSRDDLGVWQFRALRLTVNMQITLNVEFKVASELNNDSAPVFKSTFNVVINENPKPRLIEFFGDGCTLYTSEETYGLKNGTVYLSPELMFTDNVGDTVRFISASSKAPSLVKMDVIAEDNLAITFKARGTTRVTVTVADTTDENYTVSFDITNIDLAAPTFWQRILISFESTPMLWIVVVAVLIAIILIILLLVIIFKRRKRKREELEAMLISEMELEEQMMRLNAGYQSYGIMPTPTMPSMPVPPTGLMLGTGGQAPQQQNNVLNLNPGQQTAQQPPQNGNPQYGQGQGYNPQSYNPQNGYANRQGTPQNGYGNPQNGTPDDGFDNF